MDASADKAIDILEFITSAARSSSLLGIAVMLHHHHTQLTKITPLRGSLDPFFISTQQRLSTAGPDCLRYARHAAKVPGWHRGDTVVVVQ